MPGRGRLDAAGHARASGCAVIFDRGGYDGQLFNWLVEQGLDFITYQRGEVHLDDHQFVRREVRWDGQRVRFSIAIAHHLPYGGDHTRQALGQVGPARSTVLGPRFSSDRDSNKGRALPGDAGWATHTRWSMVPCPMWCSPRLSGCGSTRAGKPPLRRPRRCKRDRQSWDGRQVTGADGGPSPYSSVSDERSCANPSTTGSEGQCRMVPSQSSTCSTPATRPELRVT